MGATKEEGYKTQQLELARLAKAIGHPARLAILQELSRKDACVCGHLVQLLPLSQPTVSRHLRVLKAVGLIRSWVEGMEVYYCINQEIWRRTARQFAGLFSKGED